VNSSEKIKSALIVLEGFTILIICHAIGGYYFAPILVRYFSRLPLLTISMISSSAVSPVLAIFYVAVRVKFLPKFKLTREIFMYILSGIVMAWIVSIINVLISGRDISLAQGILRTPPPYYYLNLFLLIFWGPFLEEILFRGYFFELFRQKSNDVKALLVTSLLFVIPHGIWGSFDINLFFIFLNSSVFTLMYIQGGLITSIMIHAFVNFYLLYLNMG